MTVVLKFGGSSVANTTRIKNVANIIIDKHIKKGETAVVVISAMAGITNKLSEYISELNSKKKSPEEDVVLSAGEQVTTALLSIVLNNLGYEAQSFLGWHIPIVTDNTVGNARIISIATGNLSICLSLGKIPIIAGFQGITEMSRITTLGRGGSDTTAVAIAAAINAERCDIYTDVDGVYSADPRIVPSAKKIERISYEEMLELSASGAKVLQARSVELAMRHGVSIRVLSSFVDGIGTEISGKIGLTPREAGKNSCMHDSLTGPNDKNGEFMEKLLITGITSKQNIAKFDINISQDADSVLEAISGLYQLDVSVDLISQNMCKSSKVNNFSFITEEKNIEIVNKKCEELKDLGLITAIAIDRDVAQVSVVGTGIGLRNSSFVTILKTCNENNIPVLALTSAPLRISLITTKQNAELAVLALHTTFVAK